MDLAIGRLHLLEGNAQRAAQVLLPWLTSILSSLAGLYAAWAAALVGDRESIVRRFAALANWPGRWTVACLLLDIDPTLAENNKVYVHLADASKNPVMRGICSNRRGARSSSTVCSAP